MIQALFGGALIGLAASLLWFGVARTAGVSGILHDALRPPDADRRIRVAFLLGLVAAGVLFGHRVHGTQSLPLVAAAGILVGFGARVGGGCTSGHGVCGLSRLSLRSLVATLTFMATGAITVFLVAHVLPSLMGVR